MTEREIIPSPAATTIFVRARGARPELLLLKRGEHAKFMPNAHVFAGGAVDTGDGSAEAYGACGNFDDARASERLGMVAGGLRHFVAAIREAFEECGLLLACDSGGGWADLNAWDEKRLHQARSAVSSGGENLAGLCKAHGWCLAADRIEFFSHWITPVGMHRRYDTRFFLCPVPDRQQVSLIGNEMSEFVWLTAGEALAGHADRRLLLMYPTRMILEELARFADILALFEFARTARRIEPITPQMPARAQPDVPPPMP